MDGWTQKGFNHILRDWKTESAVSDELKESLAGIETYDQVCLSISRRGYPTVGIDVSTCCMTSLLSMGFIHG
jgi:hypothetical protein